MGSSPVGNARGSGVQLVRDSRGNNSPLVHFAEVHDLNPTIGGQDRNSTGFNEATGAVTIVAAVQCYFVQGAVDVVAAIEDGVSKLLLAGERITVPIWPDNWPLEGDEWGYISVVGDGAGGKVQLVEHRNPAD